jgi:hypothetical protein
MSMPSRLLRVSLRLQISVPVFASIAKAFVSVAP